MGRYVPMLLCVLLISCGDAPEAKREIKPPKPDPTAALIIRAETKVAEDLKDPQSTQFRKVFVSAQKLEPFDAIVCGEFNSKNSFGAYVGFQPFIYQERAPGTRKVGTFTYTTDTPTGVVWTPKSNADYKYGAYYITKVCGRLP